MKLDYLLRWGVGRPPATLSIILMKSRIITTIGLILTNFFDIRNLNQLPLSQARAQCSFTFIIGLCLDPVRFTLWSYLEARRRVSEAVGLAESFFGPQRTYRTA